MSSCTLDIIECKYIFFVHLVLHSYPIF
ncbi:hypothetical protein IFM89_010240 [Coptis chinensis]|uniref:Uncharacterized protein n=1 Tax=Coptis chinensis TaxID=261450 RepID=A0A835MAL5_9MAGN|nr:hypothetical protein IFM89_010240 [Coptis chinensis]